MSIPSITGTLPLPLILLAICTVGYCSRTLLQTCKIPLSIKPLMSLLLTQALPCVLKMDKYRACKPAGCSPTPILLDYLPFLKKLTCKSFFSPYVCIHIYTIYKPFVTYMCCKCFLHSVACIFSFLKIVFLVEQMFWQCNPIINFFYYG